MLWGIAEFKLGNGKIVRFTALMHWKFCGAVEMISSKWSVAYFNEEANPSFAEPSLKFNYYVMKFIEIQLSLLYSVIMATELREKEPTNTDRLSTSRHPMGTVCLTYV